MRNLRTGSNPCIIHAPGMRGENHAAEHPCWAGFLSISRSAKSSPLQETTIVLCNNFESSLLGDGLKRMGLDYVRLGSSAKKWNNLMKVSLMEEYLKSHRGGPILYLDSSDVAVIGDLLAVDGALDRHGCGMLFSAETKFYPRCPSLSKVEEFERSASPNEYFALNAGCWLADPSFLKELFAEFWSLDIQRHVEENQGHLRTHSVAKDDQFRWHILYSQHYPRIRLDHGCEIFQTTFLHNREDFIL